MLRRRTFLQSGISIFLPMVGRPAAEPGQITDPIFLPIPDFVDSTNLTNPQMYMDVKRVIFAATRASSAIGGIVWRVDNYIDRDNPGTPTQLFLPVDPPKYFANGEFQLWDDGFLRYVTVEVNNVQERRALGQVAYLVPGWTPR